MLFANPTVYLLTRLMGITDIVFYFGPFLLVLLIKSLKKHKKGSSEIVLFSILGILVFFVMLATGAFRVGETGRACLFLYPLLLFPLAEYFEKLSIRRPEKIQIMGLVFFQTLALQLAGHFFW
jgi:hypothetical protein